MMLLEKLLDKIEIDTQTKCWNWTGCMAGNRGHVYWQGKMRIASRAMALAKRKLCPDNTYFKLDSAYYVLHTCHNPRCINPEHLYVGTPSDNMYDRQRAGRAPDLRGEKHPQCKLTAENVKTIRTLLREGVSQRKIAKRFGVSQSQICYINTGKARREVKMTEASTQFVDRRSQEEKDAGLITQIIYWYDADQKGRRRANAMAVNSNNQLLVARSTCSKKDNFEKSKGRMIARRRLFGGAKKHFVALQLPGSPEMAEDAAKAYRNAYPSDDRGEKRAFNAGKIALNYLANLGQ